MVNEIMGQLDSLRSQTYMSQIEIKFLKDKMKVFEGTVTQTQFGFGAGIKSMPTQTAGFIQTQT